MQRPSLLVDSPFCDWCWDGLNALFSSLSLRTFREVLPLLHSSALSAVHDAILMEKPIRPDLVEPAIIASRNDAFSPYKETSAMDTEKTSAAPPSFHSSDSTLRWDNADYWTSLVDVAAREYKKVEQKSSAKRSDSGLGSKAESSASSTGSPTDPTTRQGSPCPLPTSCLTTTASTSAGLERIQCYASDSEAAWDRSSNGSLYRSPSWPTRKTTTDESPLDLSIKPQYSSTEPRTPPPRFPTPAPGPSCQAEEGWTLRPYPGKIEPPVSNLLLPRPTSKPPMEILTEGEEEKSNFAQRLADALEAVSPAVTMPPPPPPTYSTATVTQTLPGHNAPFASIVTELPPTILPQANSDGFEKREEMMDVLPTVPKLPPHIVNGDYWRKMFNTTGPVFATYNVTLDPPLPPAGPSTASDAFQMPPTPPPSVSSPWHVPTPTPLLSESILKEFPPLGSTPMYDMKPPRTSDGSDKLYIDLVSDVSSCEDLEIEMSSELASDDDSIRYFVAGRKKNSSCDKDVTYDFNRRRKEAKKPRNTNNPY